MIYSINLSFLKKSDVNILKSKEGYKILINNLSKIECFLINDNNVNVYMDVNSWSLVIKTTKKEKNILNLVHNINTLTKIPYEKYFEKIKFSGKGFRLSSIQPKKILETFFGHSHIIYVYIGEASIKRLKKYKYIFWSSKKTNVIGIKNIVKKIKPVNMYTLRGLRPTKLKLIKRKGRKSPNL